MPIVKLKSIKMYYDIVGEGEPIICVSGLSANHTAWGAVSPILSQKYKVITIDNRGVGNSDSPDQPFSIGDMAQDIIELCDHLGIQKVNFIGSSMGGFILQEIAHRKPSLAKSLVIINSGYEPRINYILFEQSMLSLRKHLKQNEPSEFFLRLEIPWIFSPQFLKKEENMNLFLKLARENPYPFSIKGHENQLNAVTTFYPKKWLGELNVPCLVTGSNDDLIFTEEHMRSFAALIPRAQYVHFDGVGHLPQIEVPEDLAAVILKFYQNIC